MTHGATLEDEQRYFDHAYDRREAARAAAKESGAVGNRHSQIALNKQNQSYLAQLAPEDVEVAYGAFQLEDGQLVYVGRDAIWDEDREPLVVNWKSAIGGLYERASVQDPQGVTFKRTFRTVRNQVKAFEDLVFADLLGRVAELTDLQISGVDDALLADLDTGRSGSMRDIVRTIQAAQSHLIRHDPDTLLVIQGGPGTGKSAVALHRVSWLLFNEDGLTPGDVLVVGPTDTFTNYIKDVLPGLGDNDVTHLSLRALGPQKSTRREEPHDTARLKGDARMADLLQRALHLRIRFAGDDPELRIGSGRGSVTVQRAAIEAAMDSIRDAPTYSAGRQRMRAWLVRQVEQGHDTDGYSRSVAVDMTAVDAALERVWPQLSAQQFVRDLLGSQNRLQEAAGDDFTAGDIGRLHRRASATAAGETWTDSDVALLDEAEFLINGMPDRYAHIVVDEAQDLSPMQLRSVARRARTGAMTVVGDIAQSTGPWARNDWHDVVEALSRDDVEHSLEELAYGYRVPAEIYEVAAKLLPYVAPGLEPVTVVRNAPQAVEFKIDNGDYDVTDEVVEAITEHAKMGRFIGVIVAPDYKQGLADELQSRGVSFSDADRGSLAGSVNLLSATEAKGLEFDAVVVVEPAAIAAADRGMSLLYVALTRATKYLTVVHAQAFEPLGLPGAEPRDPIAPGFPEPEPVEPLAVIHNRLPRAQSSEPLSPAMSSAAAAWAEQIREDVAPTKYAAVIAEIARTLGVGDTL